MSGGTRTLDALTRADLELPLGGHDLGIGAGDFDAGVEAGLVVRLDNITTKDLGGADTAVVGALGTGETVGGPSVGAIRQVEQGVLLLEAKPGLSRGMGLHEAGALVTIVVLVWRAIRVPTLAHDEDIGGAAQRIGEDGDGAQVDVRVVAGGLVRRGAVKVPLGEVVELKDATLGDLGEGL